MLLIQILECDLIASIGYLCVDDPHTKLGALYFLYLLYYTQPVPVSHEREAGKDREAWRNGDPVWPRLHPFAPYKLHIAIGVNLFVLVFLSYFSDSLFV